jgi:LacI family transcriptional regulator
VSTIRDVAKRAGVSTMTVSRVLNNSGYVSSDARQRIEAAITELGYVPNSLARSLRSKRTRSLALILTDVTNPFFTTMARGVEDAASHHGFNLILCNTDESEDKQTRYITVLLEKRVDGVLLVPARSRPEAVHRLLRQGVPVVLLDRSITDTPVDVVRGDSEQGAFDATRYLLDLGHTRIAILSGPDGVSTADDRVAGYRRAMTEVGITDIGAWVFRGEFSATGGQRMALAALTLPARPTALIAANNFIAAGAYRAVREAGLEVPGNLAMIAFDDVPTALAVEPFMTVMDQPVYEMGQRAAEVLFARISGLASPERQEIVLPMRLIVRKSTSPNAETVTLKSGECS